MRFDPGQSRLNDERLLDLKDRHRGSRAFIIGNGPSLRVCDLDRLQDEISFASNRIYLAFEETVWRPTYYTLCDAVVARLNRAAISALPIPKIMAGSARKFFQRDANAVFINFPRPEDERAAADDAYGIVRISGGIPAEAFYRKLARCCCLLPAESGSPEVTALRNDLSLPHEWHLLRGARAGHSVINLGLKAAYWMGIREVYIIGCDHEFHLPAAAPGRKKVHGNRVVISDGEENHFHPDYRRRGEEWTMPQLDIMAAEFAYARRVYEADGGRIINASRQSRLEVWEKASFDSLF